MMQTPPHNSPDFGNVVNTCKSNAQDLYTWQTVENKVATNKNNTSMRFTRLQGLEQAFWNAAWALLNGHSDELTICLPQFQTLRRRMYPLQHPFRRSSYRDSLSTFVSRIHGKVSPTKLLHSLKRRDTSATRSPRPES